MRKNLAALSYLSGMVAILQVSGCGLSEPGTVPISLGSSGVFVLQSGEPSANVITLTNLSPLGFPIQNGSMKIDPTAITVTPDLGLPAKSNINLQARNTDIVVMIANTETGQAVCQDGSQLGSFSVVFDDEESDAVSVTPPNVALSDEAIAVLNESSAVMCITVTSDFVGRVEIDELVLTVTIGIVGFGDR